MVLVDTSIWVTTFNVPGFSIDEFVSRREIVVALPVAMEVLQGISDEGKYREIRAAIFAFPLVEAPMEPEVFEEAAQIYRSGRTRGITIRSSMDCLIAACAIRNRIPVLHDDRDFDAIASFTPLKSRRIPSN
ncbi:MAG TPA: PIN domain-containing protein [Thermoanaerobaculia bacterium]